MLLADVLLKPRTGMSKFAVYKEMEKNEMFTYCVVKVGTF